LTKKSESVHNGWDRIGLSYRVEWPFHSLITRKVIKKYNEIFAYLLSIRRVQLELNQCFLLRMRLNGKSLTRSIDPQVWQTRNHMSFLIDNLQFYLQVDIFTQNNYTVLYNIYSEITWIY
jgi:gamma-tubulin complex component 4